MQYGSKPSMFSQVILIVFCLLCFGGCAYNMDPDPGLDALPDGDSDSSMADADSSDIDEEEPDGDIDLAEDDAQQSENDEESVEAPPISTEQVVYDFAGGEPKPDNYNRLPFPYNYFTRSDPASHTGLRIDLQMPPNRFTEYFNTNMIDQGLVVVSDRYLKHLNKLDGFSTFGFQFVQVHPDADETQLPQTPDASILDESLVRLINIEPGHADYGKRVPIFVELREAKELDHGDEPGAHLFNYLRCRPTVALEPATRYVFVIREGLTTSDGKLLSMSEDFATVAGLMPLDESAKDYPELSEEKTRMAPVFETLKEDLGLEASELLVAFDFTTQHATYDLENITQRYMDGELIDPDPNLDSSDPPDGQVDIYTQPTYPSDRFPGISGHLDSPNVGGICHGTFKTVNWRLSQRPDEADGGEDFKHSFTYDENGDPEEHGTEDVPFVLVYPSADHPQPFPVVVVQHGIGSKKESEVSIARFFVEKGWAVLAADFVYHGERGGFGFAPLTFIDITHPLAAQASFKQGALDHVQLFRMLNNWDMDVFPKIENEGQTTYGDGVPDLDGSKVGYIGISLGGIVGSASAAIVPDAKGFVLNVGGSGLIDFVSDFLDQYGITLVFPDFYMQQFATVAQTALEAGDGINFIRYYDNLIGERHNPRSILLQQAIPDETVPHTVSENLARSARLPLLSPVEHEVYGVPLGTSPLTQFGYSQFSPGSHGMIGGSSEESQRMRRQFIHFFETMFETGEAEIIDGVQ